MLGAKLPQSRYLLADKTYDADHWRHFLISRNIIPVIPNKSKRKKPHPFNRARYKGRNVIERSLDASKIFTAQRPDTTKMPITFWPLYA